MIKHPARKVYSLRSREKQSAMSNYVSQIVRGEVDQEQERQNLNMNKCQTPVWDRTEEINSNGHILQKKKQESITI